MNNLGYHTDSYFLEQAREITKYSDYTLVRSPNQPSFFYGNYLLLNQPPKNSDKERLEKLFKTHFTDKKVKHYTFCWSGEHKEGTQSFLNAGYKLEETSVLKARKEDLIELKEKSNDISIRAFESIADWETWVDLELEEKPEGFTETGYRKFLEGRSKVYQQLNQKGGGNFYGAYIDNQLIASAGLFHQGSIGRFQSVRTKNAFRKRGICKTLLYFICTKGFEKLDQLVIAADKGYHALAIYKGFGFKQTDAQTSVYWKEN